MVALRHDKYWPAPRKRRTPNPDHDVLRHERAVCCSRREDDWESGIDALYEREVVIYGPRGESTRAGWQKEDAA